MSASELVAKYIKNTDQVLQEIKTPAAEKIILRQEKIVEIVQYARNYFEDARYHRDHKKFEVALTSVAYCEGLLDALKLLGVAEFEWPTKK